MPERFVKEARWIAAEAQEEARVGGSSAVEAEHLLLAMTRPVASVASDVLRASGLDHTAIRQALDDEFARSLAVVGVSRDGLVSAPRVPFAGRPRWATSGKVALRRALDAARARGDGRIESGHVLLGVLAAHQGTVARAGTEPSELAAATHAAMSRSSPSL